MPHATFRPLHPLFGAELCGIAIDACNPADIADIGAALGKYGLLLCRGVAIEDAALAHFAAQFGPLQNMTSKPGARVEVIRVTNLGDDGAIKPADAASRRQHEANKLWHTDSSFIAPGATFSFLRGRIVTRHGGCTEFCDTRVAWDALPADRQNALLPLTADHSIEHSWRLSGVEIAGRAPIPPVTRKLVAMHAPSGRNALLIPSHVERIHGLDEASSRALLDELTRIATVPERVYRHRWQPNDLLIWDNRCMLHRVTPYDGDAEPRDLRSCRVIDVEDSSLVTSQALSA